MRRVAALAALAVLFSLTARADPYMDEALRLYFKHHPAAEKDRLVDFYPNPGPVIGADADVPVCDAARAAESYVGEEKSSLKYLLHGRDGWIFATANFRTDFKPSAQAMDYFTRLNAALAARGQALVILFVPPRAMLEEKLFDPAAVPPGYTTDKARAGYEGFIGQLRDAGIATVGVTTPPPDGADFFRSRDIHWTRAGARHSADLVASAIRGLDAYSSMKKQDFETVPGGIGRPAHGMYDSAMQRICKINLEIQAWQEHETVAAGDAASADSLLGDVDLPAIAVVGTSFSAADNTYGFVGTLKKNLRTDIYNAAITGGSFASAAYRYFASDEFHAHPPKVVLWEFAALHNYNKPQSIKGFRQMIPAVYGPCAAKDAVAEYNGDVTAASTDFLERAHGRSLAGTYLYMELTDPAERALQLQVLYEDGNADDVDLTRDTRAANNGKYYFELAPSAPVFFRIVTDKPQGHLAARVCRYPGGRN